ncbi:unnamed protein product [Didymodactylos carnosus]|uniref:Secreted protein n=1 Tax=Didymodactylos carnosus TaxID=1234261 RepID=A0A815R7E3_9BILA|nr:unnamed protein product [Didymodactylos carnosus]CAF1472902.1 unnamed protein product [Didymodactylos carnosus]CAF4037131.1 unnamed protein product [Didymodactylos carnosus]CAF4339987.1 unnamed protein product [Didymodactylos carnosus]
MLSSLLKFILLISFITMLVAKGIWPARELRSIDTVAEFDNSATNGSYIQGTPSEEGEKETSSRFKRCRQCPIPNEGDCCPGK